MANNFIKKAIKYPGALHKAAGVPEGEKIPEAKLKELKSKADKTGNTTLKRRLAFAETLRKIKQINNSKAK